MIESQNQRFQGITYGLWAKGCYTDTRGGKEFYTETIYTLLWKNKIMKKEIFRKFGFWALIISALAFAFSIYTFNEQRKLNHQHINPEIFSKIEFPFKDGEYNTSNPNLIVFNASPLSAASVTVDLMHILYDKNKKEVIKYVFPKHAPHGHLLFFSELSPSQSEKKDLLGATDDICVNVVVVDLSYFRPSDMKQYKKREIFFIEGKQIFTHKKYRNEPLYKELIRLVDSAEEQTKESSFFTIKAVDDHTWYLDADPNKYTITPKDDGGVIVTNKNP